MWILFILTLILGVATVMVALKLAKTKRGNLQQRLKAVFIEALRDSKQSGGSSGEQIFLLVATALVGLSSVAIILTLIFKLWTIVIGVLGALIVLGMGAEFYKRRKDAKKTIRAIKTLCVDENDPLARGEIDTFVRALTNADTRRADIQEYDPRILSDANRGSWELWDMAYLLQGGKVRLNLEPPLMARNPKADIKEGVVGIDFGTTSSVVVCQSQNQSLPMRVGLGDFSARVEKNQYENPTIISFNNLSAFLKSYKSQAGRPKTQWSDVNISHTAYSAFLGSGSNEYNAYLSELKQWAGDKYEKLQILDKQKAHFEVKGSLQIKGEDLNPIEIYAYYLGLYINNQHHGIFLNYLLSFPVTYELEVRNMILQSFKRGLAKSLPNALHNQGIAKQLKVEAGASEPAAYAIMALEGYGFDPSENERIFYGVFDFGGGTTDFDFGLFQGTDAHSRYDYTLEHFGGGGDRYLGGENLLELASFEVFKRNKDLLLEKQIPFRKPAEGEGFLGAEVLINHSQEAHTNTKSLMEKLRPLWEGKDFEDEGELSLNLFDRYGQQSAGVRLDFSAPEVLALFKERIRKGVENFFYDFVAAVEAYFEQGGDGAMDIDALHIFLAGNSSKSIFVEELFLKKIAQLSQDGFSFILHKPLESADLDKPNGKTGVAFGLIRARKGGAIQVIDNNVQENIAFKYYVGRARKEKFEILLDRKQAYKTWVKFLDASESHFELYYTSQASASAQSLSINDGAISKKSLETDVANAQAFIFVRVVSPSALEFVVATQEGLESGKYLSACKRVEL
ncbi:molecular chaperone DnaK [Helicobacter sp. L8]|uniref:molecular chaperone DnaK n=1 Tax=Helicobacter sp. L8 TaxID=2316078 RepID=UPI001F090B5B|nr:molecular chaperone DnaK [Helicobacter sp. L8]